MNHRLPLVFGLLALTGCSPNHLTAEQAVAYMIFGLEEGTLLASVKDAPAFHQTSSAPLTYVAGNPPAKVTVTFTRTDDCNYAVDFGLGEQSLLMSVDFSKLSAVSIIEQKEMGLPKHGTNLIGAQMACIKGAPGCEQLQHSTSWPFRFEDKDPSRLPEIVTYFQTNFCRGRPA
ncbi:hypothetical protein [Rhizobium leguminosarum]|uniref:hypothetical protein n=1 Tax=Rhizobium leguminosarum TaxID=384 RepID=UPI0013BAE4E8|nr:hypothetical protein [Rhizobium leguminosarum]NEI65007.1 hypothetical protein [Rhizobium leguminosarum]